MAARRGRARREPPGERAGPERAAATMVAPPLLKGGRSSKSAWQMLAFLGGLWYTDGKVITPLWGRRWRAAT